MVFLQPIKFLSSLLHSILLKRFTVLVSNTRFGSFKKSDESSKCWYVWINVRCFAIKSKRVTFLLVLLLDSLAGMVVAMQPPLSWKPEVQMEDTYSTKKWSIVIWLVADTVHRPCKQMKASMQLFLYSSPPSVPNEDWIGSWDGVKIWIE